MPGAGCIWHYLFTSCTVLDASHVQGSTQHRAGLSRPGACCPALQNMQAYVLTTAAHQPGTSGLPARPQQRCRVLQAQTGKGPDIM